MRCLEQAQLPDRGVACAARNIMAEAQQVSVQLGVISNLGRIHVVGIEENGGGLGLQPRPTSGPAARIDAREILVAAWNGWVSPQMPGPSISCEGMMKAEDWTSPRARQAFSAWVRQAGRSACSRNPQPDNEKRAQAPRNNGETRHAIA